jgi:His-Xaa-Ser system protein HxsD
MKVVYRFTDRCFVLLQHRTDKIVEVRFKVKNPHESSLDQVAGEFCNELLDQTLREIISKESEPVRNLVLAHALSRSQIPAKAPAPPQDDRRP